MPVRRIGYRLDEQTHTWRVIEEMYEKKPKQWVDAGSVFGDPGQDTVGGLTVWQGYVIDSTAVKHNIHAWWQLNEYGDKELEIRVMEGDIPLTYTMSQTGKVTFRGEIKFESLPYRELFVFTWLGNSEDRKFQNRQRRAFRIHRKVAGARI